MTGETDEQLLKEREEVLIQQARTAFFEGDRKLAGKLLRGAKQLRNWRLNGLPENLRR
jgi:hypothetical protein